MGRSKILQYAEKFCAENDIKLVTSDKTYIVHGKDKDEFAGFFFQKGNEKILGIALKAKYYRETILHEMNHALQCLEGADVWHNVYLTKAELKRFKKYGYEKDDDTTDVLNGWANNRFELDEKTLKNFSKRSLLVELDCEKRTVETCKKMLKSFKPERYMQYANAYIRSYRYLIKARTWATYTNAVDFYHGNFDEIDYLSPISAEEIKAFERTGKK